MVSALAEVLLYKKVAVKTYISDSARQISKFFTIYLIVFTLFYNFVVKLKFASDIYKW